MLYGSEADKSHTFQIAITAFIVFVFVSFVSTDRHGVFISKTSDYRIVADGREILVPRPDRRLLETIIFGSSLLSGRRGLTLCWTRSRSVMGKRSIRIALKLKFLTFQSFSYGGGDGLCEQSHAQKITGG